jgi:competence protein ComEA
MGSFLERHRGYIYLVLALASALGMYAFYARLPRPEPIMIVEPTLTGASPSASVAPTRRLQVHVVGEVMRPGVYVIAEDARVIDAVNAAGGLTTTADAEMINLADRVSDGQQIRVPGLGTALKPTLTPYPSTAQRSAEAGPVALTGGAVNINTASAGELESLPGIGPVLAQRIIAYRGQNGAFTSKEQIVDVSGIGDAIYGQIRDLITVQ